MEKENEIISENNLKESVEKVLKAENYHIDLPYNKDKFLNCLNTLSSCDKWDPDILCTFLVNLAKPLKQLSSPLGKMGEKVQEILIDLRIAYKTFINETDLSIQDICLVEKAKGVSHCNKINNKKLGFKDGQFKDYLSLSCCLNKLVRMLDFQRHIYSNMVNNKNKGPKDNIKDAFDKTLAKTFNFVKRSLFSTIIYTVSNNRSEFFSALLESSNIDDTSEEKLNEVAIGIENIYQKILTFTQNNELIVELSD